MAIDYTDFEFVKVLSISLYVLQDFFIKEIEPRSVYGLKHKTDLICALQHIYNAISGRKCGLQGSLSNHTLAYLAHYIYFFKTTESRIRKLIYWSLDHSLLGEGV